MSRIEFEKCNDVYAASHSNDCKIDVYCEAWVRANDDCAWNKKIWKYIQQNWGSSTSTLTSHHIVNDDWVIRCIWHCIRQSNSDRIWIHILVCMHNNLYVQEACKHENAKICNYAVLAVKVNKWAQICRRISIFLPWMSPKLRCKQNKTNYKQTNFNVIHLRRMPMNKTIMVWNKLNVFQNKLYFL